jgi:pimeloyl-ACP methyl ester carboxylesterase
VDKVVLVCAPDYYDSRYLEFQKNYTHEHLKGERREDYERAILEFQERVARGEAEDYFLEYHEAQKPLYWYEYQKKAENHWYGIHINQEFINCFLDRTYNRYKRKSSLHESEQTFIVFVGRYDFATPVTTWDQYEKTERIRVHIMENSGHYPMIEERDEFDEILLNEIAT